MQQVALRSDVQQIMSVSKRKLEEPQVRQDQISLQLYTVISYSAVGRVISEFYLRASRFSSDTPVTVRSLEVGWHAM